MTHALLASVFIIASCGLAYELIAAALSSYLIGDSVTQFSTVIGVYLFAMGVGSYLSRYITKGVVLRFIQIELLVAVLGGFSALALFLVFAWLEGPFRFSLYAIVLLVGHYVMRIPYDDLVGVASGATGNPAILVYSTKMAPTERPDIGYAMIFPSMTLVKVIAVQIVGLLTVAGAGG